jgi:hypothetical protein
MSNISKPASINIVETSQHQHSAAQPVENNFLISFNTNNKSRNMTTNDTVFKNGTGVAAQPNVTNNHFTNKDNLSTNTHNAISCNVNKQTSTVIKNKKEDPAKMGNIATNNQTNSKVFNLFTSYGNDNTNTTHMVTNNQNISNNSSNVKINKNFSKKKTNEESFNGNGLFKKSSAIVLLDKKK